MLVSLQYDVEVRDGPASRPDRPVHGAGGGSGQPRRLAERTLEVVMSLSQRARRCRLHLRRRRRDALRLARDQQGRARRGGWHGPREKDGLRRGETFYVPDRATERRLPRRWPSGPGPRASRSSPSSRTRCSSPSSTWTAGTALLRRPRPRPPLEVLEDRGRVGERHRLAPPRGGRPTRGRPTSSETRSRTSGEAAPAAEPQRVEHRPGGPHDGRRPRRTVYLRAAALQHPARARAQVPPEADLLTRAAPTLQSPVSAGG